MYRFACSGIWVFIVLVFGGCSSGKSSSSSAQLDFCNAGERPMLVTNQSSQTLWVGLTSGSFFCRTNTDCADAGGMCIITGSDAIGPLGNCGCSSSNNFSCGSVGGCATNTEISPLSLQTYECINQVTQQGYPCKTNSDCSTMGSQCSISNGVGYCTCTPTLSSLCGGQNPQSVLCSNTAYPNPYVPPPTAYTCFWLPPRFPEGPQTTPKLTPNQSLKLCFPKPSNSRSKTGHGTTVVPNVQWSGNLFARLMCDKNGQNCGSGNCSNSTAYCSNCPLRGDYCASTNTDGLQCFSGRTSCALTPCGPGYVPLPGHTYEQDCPNNGACAPQNGNCELGAGGSQPTTLAEFTLTSGSPSLDYYDVSIIGGINIGISMAPDSNTTTLSSTDPYFCATPGSKQQTDPLKVLRGCGWNIAPFIPGLGDQTVLLTQVVPATPPLVCTNNSDCVLGQSCGLAMNVVIPNQSNTIFTKVCGTPVAYWSASQIATALGSGSGSANTQMVSPIPTDLTSVQQFGCTGTAGQVSCYQNTSSCGCGCPTFPGNLYGASWPNVLSSQGNCMASNSTWVSNIQPWLVFMKQACPTAYTFPFDDKTSTFTCSANAGVAAGEGPGYYINLFDTTYAAH